MSGRRTSEKLDSSSYETARGSTFMPRAVASCISILFVIDSRIESDAGVTYVPVGNTRSAMSVRRGSCVEPWQERRAVVLYANEV